MTSLTGTRRPSYTIERLETVSPAVAEEYLSIYRAAFAPLEDKSPARQSLTDEEFRHDMGDSSVVKFAARLSDASVVAMAFMATDLTTVPWISPAYYAAKFPEHAARKAIFYFGALLVRPDRQGGPWVKVLVEEMARFVGEHRAIAAFDCCQYNVEVAKLPDLLARVCHRVVHLHTEELEPQRYYAYLMDGVR